MCGERECKCVGDAGVGGVGVCGFVWLGWERGRIGERERERES